MTLNRRVNKLELKIDEALVSSTEPPNSLDPNRINVHIAMNVKTRLEKLVEESSGKVKVKGMIKDGYTTLSATLTF